jgi:O-methyltransferase domain
VAQAHPHLRGIGFDLPLVRPVFEDFVAGHSLSDRVVFKGGDFFVDTLPKTDVIVMGHVLHDWDLGQKKALLGKAFEALPKGGAVIAYDPILDDDRRQNTFSLLATLNMLIETEGGFEYTGADCQAWMREAGDPRGASSRPALHGDRDQIGHRKTVAREPPVPSNCALQESQRPTAEPRHLPCVPATMSRLRK